MQTRTLKSQNKRNQIIVVALDCFTRHGVESTTIEMICAASDTSVGSLYHHFGNKEKIAAAVFIAGMQDFASLMLSYIEQANSLEAGVKQIVYANIDWISANPDWANFVFHHRQSLSLAGAEISFAADMRHTFKQVTAWMGRHANPEQMQQLPLELLPALISGPTHNHARQWLAGRTRHGLKEYRTVLAAAAWHSVKGLLENDTPPPD